MDDAMRWTASITPKGILCVARSRSRTQEPWIYVYPGKDSEIPLPPDTLHDWLNGEGNAPAWIAQLRRVAPHAAIHEDADGRVLRVARASGPIISTGMDIEDFDEDPAFADARANLMDVLCGVRPASSLRVESDGGGA
ncbi:MAG: hypothetical protein ACPGVG_16000 [Mycobacterium sp.]